MSEQGWRAFLAAGLPDWAVLHSGAVAVYRVRSLAAAANLAQALAQIPGLSEQGALITLADQRVSIRLTRDIWQLEENLIALARAVSAVAARNSASPDRAAIQEVQFAIAAKPDMIDVNFWRAVLGYNGAADDNAVDPLGHGSTVWMQHLDVSKALRHAMHIDVSVPRDQVEQRLAAAIAAGGHIVDDSHAPTHWTLSDRAGNRVCICAWPDGFAETVK